MTDKPLLLSLDHLLAWRRRGWTVTSYGGKRISRRPSSFRSFYRSIKPFSRCGFARAGRKTNRSTDHPVAVRLFPLERLAEASPMSSHRSISAL
jgi:hypothetical protein